MLDTNKNKSAAYALMGLGAGLVTFAFFKSRSAKAATSKALNAQVPRGSKVPTLESASLPLLTSSKSLAPALVYVPSDDKAYPNNLEAKTLNFTPRRLSDTHDESLNHDLNYLKDVHTSPKGYIETLKRKGYKDSEILHPNDFQILQINGVIPKNFPLNQIEIVKSLNGLNTFMVGYSKPTTFDMDKVQTKEQIEDIVPKEKIKVIKPLWAVSFGKVFNPTATLPESLKKIATTVRNVTTRIQVAEGMTGRSNFGCDYRLSQDLCNAEKTALMGIYLNRYFTKRKSKPKTTFTDPVYKFTVPWNKHPSFMSTFHTWLGRSDKHEVKDRRSTSFFPESHKNVAKDFYDNFMWSTPDFGGHASHYIHPDPMTQADPPRDAPKWVWTFRPLDRNAKKYNSQHPVLIGRLIASDNTKDFR